MKKKILWITGTCFFDVDENVVPKVSKLYDLYWVVLRQSVSFYSLEYIRNFMRQNEVKGYVSNLGKMSSFRAFKNYLSMI